MANARSTAEFLVRRYEGRAKASFARVWPRYRYRFAMRDWRRTRDVDVATALAVAERWFTSVLPIVSTLEGLDRVVVLAPHQDDEVIGAGGALALLAERGAAISIVFMSDGRRNVRGRELRPVLKAESDKVAAALHASTHWLDVPHRSWIIGPQHLEALRAVVRDARPDALLCPWVLDSPPAHRLTLHTAVAALGHDFGDLEMWAYQVHTGIVANVVVDITEVIDAKRSLIRSYESQLEEQRRYDHIALGLNAWNNRFLPEVKGDTKARYAEAFFVAPLRDHAEMVKRLYANIEAAYRGNPLYVEAARRLVSL